MIGPIESSFGLHFIWVAKVIPPKSASDEEIDQQIRLKLLPEVRTYELNLLVEQLKKQTDILYNQNWLDSLNNAL